MFSLLLRFPANRSFFSMIFSGQEEKNLCHAMPCHAMPCHAMPSHKRFDTWPSFKQGNDRLNTTHKLVIVRNVTLEVFPLFFLTYECYAVHGVQALGASKLFCCHKYFRVPKLGLFYAFCGLFSLRARFDLRCSLALMTSVKSLFLWFSPEYLAEQLHAFFAPECDDFHFLLCFDSSCVTRHGSRIPVK